VTKSQLGVRTIRQASETLIFFYKQFSIKKPDKFNFNNKYSFHNRYTSNMGGAIEFLL
jgi:hypothetical protein